MNRLIKIASSTLLIGMGFLFFAVPLLTSTRGMAQSEQAPVISTPVSGPLPNQADINTEAINAISARFVEVLHGRGDTAVVAVLIVLMLVLGMLGGLYLMRGWHHKGHDALARIETKVDRVSKRQRGVVQRVTGLETKVEIIDTRVERVEALVSNQKFTGTMTDTRGNRSPQKIEGEIHPTIEGPVS